MMSGGLATVFQRRSARCAPQQPAPRVHEESLLSPPSRLSPASRFSSRRKGPPRPASQSAFLQHDFTTGSFLN